MNIKNINESIYIPIEFPVMTEMSCIQTAQSGSHT